MRRIQNLDQIDDRTLYLNLVLTQGILLVIGLLLYYVFLKEKKPLGHLFHLEDLNVAIMSGVSLAAVTIGVDLILMRWAPKGYFDDGGINERIFKNLAWWQIFVLALGVAFIEEWLFRTVLQNIVGWFWASLIFAFIHVRYWSRWLFALLILLISFSLGGLYAWTLSFWSVFTAHFLIDFCLGIIIRYRLFSINIHSR